MTRGGRAGWGMRQRLRWRISMRIAGLGWIGWGNIRRWREEKLGRWDSALAGIWRFARRFRRMYGRRFVTTERVSMMGNWGRMRMQGHWRGRRKFAGSC